MHRKAINLISGLGLGAAGLLMAFAAPLAAQAAPTPAPVVSSAVYDALPSPLPPNVASVGFEATSTSEFGDYVLLAGTNRTLNTVTVTMSDWALAADYPTLPATGWTHPITVNVYSDSFGVNGVPTTLLATKTQTVNIPWRPAGPVCPSDSTAWVASDGLCYHGLAFNATFDMSSSGVTLPNNVIVSVAYNTQSYGAAPIGVAGPYNSLNVGIPTGQTATVGSDNNTDAVFWNSSTGTGGLFVENTGWTPNGTVAFKITATAALVGPPTNKDQCKKDGWKTFNNPAFKNQGQCVAFVENQSH